MPDMKPQVYKDPRPKEHFDRFHERTRTKGADWMYEVVRMVLTPILFLIFRARCIASDNVPQEGPVIIAPNHFSFMDHFFQMEQLGDARDPWIERGRRGWCRGRGRGLHLHDAHIGT